MNEHTRLFLWVLASGGCFAALFGLFGAVTGAVNWRNGRPAGTVLGLAAVRAYDRLSDEKLRPGRAGAIVGGIDGAVFGTAIGTLVGAVAGWHFPAEWDVLRPVLLTAAVLAGAALALGAFAGLVLFVGTRAVLGMFVGGMAGALLGASWYGLDGLYFGVLAGAVAGVGVMRLRS